MDKTQELLAARDRMLAQAAKAKTRRSCLIFREAAARINDEIKARAAEVRS